MKCRGEELPKEYVNMRGVTVKAMHYFTLPLVS